ncbi:MAG: efflux RND transporter permease subunit [Pseudomonadota bacterium]
MTGIVDWAASRARMVLAFVILSILAGTFAYISLPKEGEPDIEIPAVFISVPFPGISASDAETLLVKPIETEVAEIDGLDTMSSTAAEGYANVILEFEFGWDKTQVLADVRDAMTRAEAEFPAGGEQYTLGEFNFSEFPIIIVSLSGPLPERTLSNVADDLQDELEAMDAVLEANITGNRDEMLEVVIDPLRLEAYNVTAGELINVVQNNNQLIAAGEVDGSGTFAVKINSSFDEPVDVYSLPVKTNGDRVVTLGDLAEIRLTFEDRTSTARFNGEATIALQVSKRKGFNLIDTADQIRALVAERQADWPEGLRAMVEVESSNDQSRQVSSMVQQLEGSVLTAIILVMLVGLAALGIRASLLVGFAIPTSFLLCFVLLAVMGISISNIVMFGLILSVGMLVDGAIVVTEYADKRQAEGVGPMQSYVEAAKRMFWPVISSTATTLCAFLPMLFWPGVPGEFMGMLPVTLIFVLSASLVVALIYLPVMGGMLARATGVLSRALEAIARMPLLAHLGLIIVSVLPVMAAGALVPQLMAGIGAEFGGMDGRDIFGSVVPVFASVFLHALGAVLLGGAALAGAAAIVMGVVAILPRIGINIAALFRRVFGGRERRVRTGKRRTAFGRVIEGIVANPVMPLVMVGCVFVFVGSTLMFFINNNRGVEFFVETEPEQAIVYVLARGNMSLDEKDDLLREAEDIVRAHPGIYTVFSFAGSGGLNANTGGAQSPGDTIGQMQIETIPWEDRPTIREPWFEVFGATVYREVKDPTLDGDVVLAQLTKQLEQLPGIKSEILNLAQGPASAKPVHLRLKGDNLDTIEAAAAIARAEFDRTPALTLVEDTRPLPGIDWEIDVDVEKAGRYGADVATVGAMVQLVTRGILLDTYTPAGGDEEIEIRVRLPEEDRVLSTLDTLKVRTSDGLVPLANFITRAPVPSLALISRVDQQRYYDVKSDVLPGFTKLVQIEEAEDGTEIQRTVATLIISGGGTITLEDGQRLAVQSRTPLGEGLDLQAGLDAGDLRPIPVNANERITELTKWLETDPFPAGIEYEWTGDQEDQAESQAFLQTAFSAALGLMFIILLAQFNSFYNAVLVLLAVILSTTGVLIGMVVMDQTFSIIMTGTGIVALAGIVVNNNIVLIDTYQEYEKYMPRIEAIIRTAQDRIRPVLLTTITTMAGLAPMMFGLSIDFGLGGYTVDSPTALWWKQLATAVVFGLGIATVLTLMVTPSLLSIRVWVGTYAQWIAALLARFSMGRASRAARDWALDRDTQRLGAGELIWDEGLVPDGRSPDSKDPSAPSTPLRAAE